MKGAFSVLFYFDYVDFSLQWLALRRKIALSKQKIPQKYILPVKCRHTLTRLP